MGGINFRAKEGYKLFVQGTDIEVTEFYGRTRFIRSLCGKKLQIQCNMYWNEIKFKANDKSVMSLEVLQIQDGNKVVIPSVGNYGEIETPEDYDNNDLALSHSHVCSALSAYLEIFDTN